MREKKSVSVVLTLVILTTLGTVAVAGSCNNGSPADRTTVRIRDARDALNSPTSRILLPRGRRLMNINYVCITQDPQCLTVLTRALRADETPETYELAIPYAWGKIPRVITVVEQAARPAPATKQAPTDDETR